MAAGLGDNEDEKRRMAAGGAKHKPFPACVRHGEHGEDAAILIGIYAAKGVNPKMNTTAHAGARLTSAGQTVQTVFLIVVTLVGTWLGVYRVPWQASGDPCILATGLTAGIVTCLWLTRWRGSHAVIFERNLLAGFLVVMPLVYVARYLVASTARGENYWFWIEVLGTAFFVALAVLGVKRSPWFLAAGMVLHGLAWDAWHYRNSTYIPDWYVIACLAVDLSFGAYIAARIPEYQRAVHMQTAN